MVDQPEVTSSAARPLQPKPRNNKTKAVLLIILSILLVAGLVGGTYAWQQSRVNDLQTQLDEANDRIDQLNRQNESEATQEADENANGDGTSADVPVTSDESEAIAAARTYCEARVSHVFELWADDEQQVVFSPNREFAKINAKCDLAGEEAPGALYTLKKVGDKWVVIHLGTDVGIPNPELYGYPADF